MLPRPQLQSSQASLTWSHTLHFTLHILETTRRESWGARQLWTFFSTNQTRSCKTVLEEDRINVCEAEHCRLINRGESAVKIRAQQCRQGRRQGEPWLGTGFEGSLTPCTRSLWRWERGAGFTGCTTTGQVEPSSGLISRKRRNVTAHRWGSVLEVEKETNTVTVNKGRNGE